MLVIGCVLTERVVGDTALLRSHDQLLHFNISWGRCGSAVSSICACKHEQQVQWKHWADGSSFSAIISGGEGLGLIVVIWARDDCALVEVGRMMRQRWISDL